MKKQTEKMVTCSIVLPAEVIEKLDTMAQKLDMSRAHLVRKWVYEKTKFKNRALEFQGI